MSFVIWSQIPNPFDFQLRKFEIVLSLHHASEFPEYPSTSIEGVGYLVHVGRLSENEITNRHQAVYTKSHYH